MNTAAADAPYWLQFVQPFGTVFLGLSASVIALRQWQTARDKIILDLFQRRIQIYADIKSSIGIIIHRGLFDNPEEHVRRFDAAVTEARFLFGAEVIDDDGTG